VAATSKSAGIDACGHHATSAARQTGDGIVSGDNVIVGY
jgi:hypothetical protein